ncbi:thioredoxin-like protein [Hyaloraphidium curvatum]|nr:thioredoxin-like protein [Hyaloraphidium curvatum]
MNTVGFRRRPFTSRLSDDADASKHRVDFFFDYLSPFAYLAYFQLKDLRAQFQREQGRTFEFNLVPVVFGKLLDYWGNVGPAEVPSKRLWLAFDTRRFARVRWPDGSVKVGGPKRHPFKPVLALRLSLKEISGSDQEKVVDALWRGAWDSKYEYDVSDPADLQTLLVKFAGLSPARATQLLDLANQETAKQALMRTTADAIEKHRIWGVPVTVVDGQDVYWGNDQIPYVELQLRGKGVLTQAGMSKEEREDLETWEQLQRGIDRKGMNPNERLKGKL